LVTGASGGLGAAIVCACAARGAHMVVTGRRTEVLRGLAAHVRAEVVSADLSDVDAVVRLVDRVGVVDVLISNAALPAAGPLGSFSVEEIDRAIAVNLRAPMVLSRLLSAPMVARGRGHLVFVASLAAAFPTPGLTVYNATKSALAAYGLSLRAELRPDGVGVSVVYPGPIGEVGMWADTGLRAPPGLRPGTPRQVGAAVVRAVERDRAEVSVGPKALRAAALVSRTSPGAFAKVAPHLGATNVADAIADALRHKR
jgi:short-subunit dehydrogenase